MHKPTLLVVGVLSATLALKSAYAHHLMDGQTAGTPFEGFLSGLFHPIIGLDHLAFIIAVGVISALTTKRLILPLVFIVATSVGALTMFNGISVPALEFLIILSIIVFGLGLLSGKALSNRVLATLHGNAYGGTIIGAETSSLIAYIAGFTIVQYFVAIGSVYFFFKLWKVK